MSNTTTAITNHDDIIDVRDVIKRFEYLEDSDDERRLLRDLLDEIKGQGGDEKWGGSWYPLTLVRDSYFSNFAQEEAFSSGLMRGDAKWPYNCIDWDQAAKELQGDYTSCDFDGVPYWYRGG